MPVRHLRYRVAMARMLSQMPRWITKQNAAPVYLASLSFSFAGARWMAAPSD